MKRYLFASVLRISVRSIRSEALSTNWKWFCALQALLSGSERKTLRVSKGEEESATVAKSLDKSCQSPDKSCQKTKKYPLSIWWSSHMICQPIHKDSGTFTCLLTLFFINRTKLLPNFSNLNGLYLEKMSIFPNWSTDYLSIFSLIFVNFFKSVWTLKKSTIYLARNWLFTNIFVEIFR
jgi:hypothetical protein